MSGSPAVSTGTSMLEEPPEQRRTLAVLLLAQILSGAGLAAGITVGALLAEQMLGSSRLSGLPTVFFTIGSAATAVGVGRVSQRLGRRAGLTAGYLTGAVGSLGVVVAASFDNVVLLFASLLVYGAGVSTNLQARYTGADLAAPSRRGRAVSIVLVATAVGAIIGPNLVRVTGTLAARLGIPALAGPFMLAAAAYASAGLVLWLLLRPDPLLLARSIAAAGSSRMAEANPEPSISAATSESRRGWSWAVAGGAGIMILSQLIMVAIMTMTPIHIEHHGHGLAITGVVIAAHVAGMFLPSPFSGWLVDRFGYLPIAAAAGLTLLAAGLLAAWAPVDSVGTLLLALVLLGLGWNLGLVSGTTLVTDAVPLATRARTQGVVDFGVSLAGAGGGLSSGLIVSATSYATLTLAGGILALLIIPIAAIVRGTRVDEAAIR
ncbi:MAG TPA: MFS transporter [Propionibacteriaceae bacterium]|nr:MFS transporter [Propionibacteriaceae bacterium]